MHKDKRYSVLKFLITKGQITKLEEIFDIIPKTVVSKDLDIHYIGLVKRINNLGLWSIGEIIAFAKLIEVEETMLVQLILKEISNKGRNKK